MKIIIAGSRHYIQKRQVFEYIDMLLKQYNIQPEKIISGGATGVDTMAIEYAIENNIPYHVENAEWEKFGRKAGMIRNKKMSEMGDILIAIWNGKSKGTKNMIDVCERNRNLKKNILRVFVMNLDEPENFSKNLI